MNNHQNQKILTGYKNPQEGHKDILAFPWHIRFSTSIFNNVYAFSICKYIPQITVVKTMFVVCTSALEAEQEREGNPSLL